jgi:hypothetical protein
MKKNRDEPRYVKHPDQVPCSINGVQFDDDTVVSGSEWDKWTRKDEFGRGPKLVRLNDAKELKKKTFVQPPPLPPPLPRSMTRSLDFEQPRIKPAPIPKPKPEMWLNSESDSEIVEIDEEYEERPLTDIKGVGHGRAMGLISAGYCAIENVADADPGDLAKAMNTGTEVAERIILEARKLLVQ